MLFELPVVLMFLIKIFLVVNFVLGEVFQILSV